jgi:hypothetical protein
MNVSAGRIVAGALLALCLLFSIALGVPQGKGSKGSRSSRGNDGNAGNRDSGTARRPTPGLKSGDDETPNGEGAHQSCVHSCNAAHKQAKQSCKGRTGPERAACEQAVNEQHRLCVTSCPK